MLSVMRVGFAVVALFMAVAACTSSNGGTPVSEAGLGCTLGSACSLAQLCMGGIEGCASNCQCLDGTWQAPCPAALPATGSACTAANAECGYTTTTNPCGADNCYCQNGTWSCGSTCTYFEGGPGAADGGGDAAVSGGAAACVAAGGQCVQGVGYCAQVGPGASPGSCLEVSPAMLCCAVNADAGCTEIEASSYDQTCTSDSDCVEVNVGNPCEACIFSCAENQGAINVGAMTQYSADVAKTPAHFASCGCPSEFRSPACCRGGQCHADGECVSSDGSTGTGDASAE